MRVFAPLLSLTMSLPALAQRAPDLAGFGFGLLRSTLEPGADACLSPWSAAIALAMARAGAAGETASEMDRALGLDAAARALLHGTVTKLVPNQTTEWVDGKPQQVAAFELSAANAAWVGLATKLRESYTKTLQSEFAAAPQRVDFAKDQARATINRWVEAQTKQRIRELIPAGAVNPGTRLVLVNCLYLNARWAQPFDAALTQPRPFTLGDGKQVDVPTMHDQRQMRYGQTKQAQFALLPFRGGELQFVVIVPREGVAPSDVAKEFAVNWSSLMDAAARHEVQLYLPKFSFDAGLDLADGLKSLGMRQAFDRARADFSAMTEDDPVFIAAVLHKTFVKVDEFATEAAAATGVIMAPTSARPDPQPPVELRADRPFLFAIQHASGPLLFVGLVADPR